LNPTKPKLYEYDGDSENVLYDEEYWLVEQAFQNKQIICPKESKDFLGDWEEAKNEEVKANQKNDNSGCPDECGEKVLNEQEYRFNNNGGADYYGPSVGKGLYKCETEREHMRGRIRTTSHNFNTNAQRTTRVLSSNQQFGNCSLSSSGAFN